jgi:DsbC/DsbD-like thiol-disulfide interchange protein
MAICKADDHEAMKQRWLFPFGILGYRRAMRMFLLISGLLAAFPVCAAETGWQELAPDTRIRLIASEARTPGGQTLLAIELDMPQNTKTYWRVPGETGIPTRLDLAGSTGISGHRLHWPYPEVEQQQGYTDFVYYGPVVIPVELMVEGDHPVVEASILMGVCSDICIPATARFSLPLDFSTPDPGHGLRINQALALTPLPWTGAGEAVGEADFDAASGLLSVPVDAALADPASIIADASGSGHLFGAPQKSPEPGLVTLPLLGGVDGAGLEGKSIQLIFMTRNGPFEVSRRVGRSTPGGS